MRKNLTLMTCLLLILGVGRLSAAYTAPQSGKVYRIHNSKNAKVIGEDGIARELVSVDAAANDFTQLWLLKESGSGFLVQNAYSGQYLQPCAQQSTQVYPTGTTESVMNIKKESSAAYSIGQSSGAYLHLDNSNNIVRWWDASNAASQWNFEEVSVSAEAVALQQAAFKTFYEEYEARLELMNHLDEYNAVLPTFFADAACTELQPAYAAMSDAALRTAMSALPVTLQDMAVKIKNAAWGHREAEFRIRNYKAYSDADYWGEILYTKKYCRINNPTGIYGNAGDVLYVFVGNDIPEGATLHAEIITGTSIQGESTPLEKGLNMIPVKKNFSNLFIQYIGATSLTSDALITDYPELEIHVEQGVVNGYWDIAEHDDADWVDMKNNLFTADVVQVKGERMLFHMSRKYITECCSTTITDAIGWWDDMTRWQQDMLGIEDVRLSKFNNLGCAISLTSGYQSATHYRTQYAETYIENLLPYEKMMSNADNCWGPAHENGHVHQAAIQSVGTSEVSNNFFSNLTLFKLGRYTSRGMANDVIFTDFAQHTPYILRDGATTMRMFWQLYLYFHEVKGDATFYPRVLQAMRATPFKARDPKYYAMSVYGNEDLLLFAKACCDVAEMDLSEFFRFWGYLELTEEQHIGDYGNFYLTTRESDVEEFLAHAAQYPKAPSIIFIEDRVKAEPRTDGGEGNKLHHGNAVRVGEAGDVGHYTDFVDTTVKAEGYLYEKDGARITINGGTGALGFKVYAKADTTLLYGSNRLTFTLPESVVKQDIRIVAAQADGADVEVKSIAEGGTEEQQLAELQEVLTLALNYLEKTDDRGVKIGYLQSDSAAYVRDLTGLIGEVVKNKDQSTHTYGEWYVQLNSALLSLLNNPAARVPITPNCFYSITTSSESLLHMVYHTDGLRTAYADAEDFDSQWRFVPAGTEGTYYLQSRRTGNYVSSVRSGVRVKAATTKQEEAVAFVVVPGEVGEFLLQSANDNTLNLYNSKENRKTRQVLAGTMTDDSSTGTVWWSIAMQDDLLDLPISSGKSQCEVYFISDVASGKYLYQYTTGRYAGRISSSENGNSEDANYLFYFYAGATEGTYNIYNYASKQSVVANDKYLMVNGDASAPVEYHITKAADGSGWEIACGDKFWGTTTYTLLGDTKSVYKFQYVGAMESTSIEDVTVESETTGVCFDLMGRPVDNPTSGIYIHNGKKLIVQ